MILQTIVYVGDLDRSIAFYEALGLGPTHRSRGGVWAELRLGDAVLALHRANLAAPAAGQRRVDVSFVSEEPLEELAGRLAAAGVPLARGIADEAFGRSLLVRDPDGLPIQVNEHDPS